MKIAIIGGGYSGVILALLLRRNDDYNKFDITIFEKENKLLKKIYATGNGRCNLGNLDYNHNSYNNIDVYKIYNQCDINKQIQILKSFGIETCNEENYVYPFSKSAKNYIYNLLYWVDRFFIKVKLNKQLINYKKIKNNKFNLYFSDNTKYGSFDIIIFATGGKSGNNLGSDGNLFSLFSNKGYKISELKPGLTSIKTIEDTLNIQNERINAKVSLLDGNNKEIYSEIGEVLFKKDGLSGICIFNVNSMILRNNLKYKLIKIDPFFANHYKKDKNLEIRKNEIYKNNKELHGFFNKNFSDYMKINMKEDFCLYFNYKESNDFTNSQVTIGGISLDNLYFNTLQSKIEHNVLFLGETLDVDGLCGGYNLMISFSSAFIVYKYLITLV